MALLLRPKYLLVFKNRGESSKKTDRRRREEEKRREEKEKKKKKKKIREEGRRKRSSRKIQRYGTMPISMDYLDFLYGFMFVGCRL